VLPLLAFVGRPNVGKSTLFNRVIGRRLAIVEDVPGVTRDRQYAEADHDGRRFRAVDTGGFTPDSEAQLVRAVREQAEAAIREADAIVLVVDAEEGLSGADQELARILRKGGKPVLLAANKVDSDRREKNLDLGELHALGFDVFPVSAEHGRGVSDLLDAAVTHLPEPPEGSEEEQGQKGPVRLAVVGRPNVGKSTLLNRLIGEERFVASAMPGTSPTPPVCARSGTSSTRWRSSAPSARSAPSSAPTWWWSSRTRPISVSSRTRASPPRPRSADAP